MKTERGAQGYLKQKKRQALFQTLLMTAIGLLIFIAGLMLNKMEPANIFTVAAVLMVIPAAKALTTVIVLFPYQETSQEDRKRMDAYAQKKDTVLYDLVFTSSEMVMHLNQVYVTDHQIIGISMRKRDDIAKAQEYLKKELSARCLSYSVFLTQEENALKKRMELRAKEAPDRKAGQEKQPEEERTLIPEGAKEEVIQMLKTFTI